MIFHLRLLIYVPKPNLEIEQRLYYTFWRRDCKRYIVQKGCRVLLFLLFLLGEKA